MYRFIIFSAIFLIIVSASCSSSHIEDNNLSSAIDDICFSDNFSGSVLVAFRDSVIVDRAYGFSDKTHRTANSSETIYPIASVTKLFIKQAVLSLIDKDSLSLNSRLSEYLNSVMFSEDITIDNLIHHQSGLPDIHNRIARYDNPWLLNYPIEPDDLIDSINSFGKLDFTPGNRTAYSNSNYLILARIVEAISGKPLDEYLKATIFAPYGMSDTGLYGDHSHVKGHAKGFSTIRGSVVYTPDFNFRNFWGSGNGYSTTGNLYSYYRASKLLLPEHIRSQIIQHSGLYTGYRSFYKVVPEIGLVIVILSNSSSVNQDRLIANIADYYRDILLKSNRELTTDKYSGGYVAHINQDIVTADITFECGRYMYNSMELICIDNRTFLIPNSGFTSITFSNSGFVINDNGIMIRFKRSTGNE